MNKEMINMTSLDKLFDTVKNSNCITFHAKKLPFSISQIMYDTISTKEIMHSKIIAELLEPTGKHNCKDIFLTEFMRLIGICPEEENFDKIVIKPESSTKEYRRIDILITWDDKAVIIENKMNDAVAQPNQLRDYLRDTEDKGKEVIKIVYLPLYEWKKSKEVLSTDVSYCYISDLIRWLKNCIEKGGVEIQRIATQYIELLEYINIVNLNYMKAKELYDLLSEDRELLKLSQKLTNIIHDKEWRKVIKEKIYHSILDELKKRSPDNIDNLEVNNRENDGELWLWYNGNYKYWISVDIYDKDEVYRIHLYYDDQQKNIPFEFEESGKARGGYYYTLKDKFDLYDEDAERQMISKVIELLQDSKRC